MPDIKLSIIIPVYNVEKYVQECIDSIVKQIDKTCEIILVDDGSTDASGNICENNAGEGIKVIHKQNGGLSSARNAGLKQASGKYISFVDSDDLIEEDSIKAVINWIDSHNSDVCFMQAVKFYPDGTEEPMGDDIVSMDIDGKLPDEVIEFLASRKKYPGSACTKLYKREFLENNRIDFPHDLRRSEDLGFTMDCLTKANSFSAIDCPYYRYRQNREGSITGSVNMQTVEGLLAFERESVEKLTTNRIANDHKSELAMSFAAYEYMVLLHNYSGLAKADRKSKKKEVKQLRWVLKYGKTLKTKLVRIMAHVIGVSNTAAVIRKMYEKLRYNKRKNI